jgi:tetratricopeptide (TPR) repeat protein
VTRWLQEIRDQPSAGAYLGIQVAYAYSFYQQGWGSTTNGNVSADEFFLNCLAHLKGVDETVLRLRSTGEKGKWPAEILSFLNDHRSLLVLDGLETNQVPRGKPAEGTINDVALREFVKKISMKSGGLCIITSRIMPRELERAGTSHGPMHEIPLRPLDDLASARVLVAAGVSSDNPDLAFWVGAAKGHPLLLALLAPMIQNNMYKPDEFKAHRVLTANGKQDLPETIRKVVWANLERLGDEARALLLCACMFEKATEFDVIRKCLVDRAAIDLVTVPLLRESLLLKASRKLGLFSALNGFRFLRPTWSERNVHRGADRLVKAALLVEVEGDDPRLWKLEAHPVIQAGIRSELSGNHAALWKRANWTIYKSLTRSVKPRWPEKLEELKTIYAAVPHGVHAGKGLRAGWTYAIRCLRGYRAYSTNQHGMIAEDVSALSHYFEGHWEVLKEDIGLNDYAKVQAYVWSGALLTGVNRWQVGRGLMERGLALAKEKHFWSAAGRTATHLAVGYSISGELRDAEKFAREAIHLLQESQPWRIRLLELPLVNHSFQRMAASATLGSVLHYQGRFEDAEQAFQDAAMHLRRATKYKTLRAIWCFRQVELLLDQGKFDEADRLIEQAMIEPTQPKGWGEGIFCEPLLQLASVRTYIRRFDMSGGPRDSGKAEKDATGFATFGKEHKLKMDWLIPVFKIALSGVARLAGRLDEAKLRIEEADKWAEQSGNKLFETDVRTEQARVHLAAVDEKREALQRIGEAEELSIKIGYHCRLVEISHLKNLCG